MRVETYTLGTNLSEIGNSISLPLAFCLNTLWYTTPSASTVRRPTPFSIFAVVRILAESPTLYSPRSVITSTLS